MNIFDYDDCGLSYNTATATQKNWSSFFDTAGVVNDAIAGRNVVQTGSPGGAYDWKLARPFVPSVSGVDVNGNPYYNWGFAFRFRATNIYSGPIIQVQNSGISGPTLFYFTWNSDNSVTIRVHAIPGQQDFFRTFNVAKLNTFNNWTHLYCFVEASYPANSGRVTIKINNNLVFQQTFAFPLGYNAVAPDSSIYNPTGIYFAGFVNISDYVALDTTGGVDHNYLGEAFVGALFPNADQGTNQFTNGAGGSHYAQVNATVPNSGATKLTSVTAGQIELYNYAAISPSVSKILAVCPTMNASLDIPGARTIQPIYNNGANTLIGTAYNPGSGTYFDTQEITTINPATGLAWTVADLNGNSFGFKCIT